MAYAVKNFPSKKALVEAFKAGEQIKIYSPGPFPVKQDGREVIEGPHYPKMHSFYVPVEVKGGVVVKILK